MNTNLESLSLELKELVSEFDTQWFLGDLSKMIRLISSEKPANDLKRLTSPLRQIYYLGGLLLTSELKGEGINYFVNDIWEKIVDLLNDIDEAYNNIFLSGTKEELSKNINKIRVVMPSYYSYFYQGPLNFEEQIINSVIELYSQFDSQIEKLCDLKTVDFVRFYEKLDALNQSNIQIYTQPEKPIKLNWRKYTKIELISNSPKELLFKPTEKEISMFHYFADYGIVNRFFPEELVSIDLDLVKVEKILKILKTTRGNRDFSYFAGDKFNNPLYISPIIELDDRLFQVFEMKQIIHAIENILEKYCSINDSMILKLNEKKGKLLEKRIVELFKEYFNNDCKVFENYFVDGIEQDVLVLWKNYAFIIEAKGYKYREPFRNIEKAYVRILDDFNDCILKGYEQTKRIEKKFINNEILKITDKNGNLLEEIDTSFYKGNDFSIIVNLKSFGNIQTNLSVLLKKDEDDVFPWVVKFDDLEVFLSTIKAKNMNPKQLIKFLQMREEMHEKLLCSDELQVCGGFLQKFINQKINRKADLILSKPQWALIFDEQYIKGMGLKNEKHYKEKIEGTKLFIR